MAELQGKDTAGPKESHFKSSGVSRPQGMGAAVIAQGIVLDVNVRNWTVDVKSKFDRRKWFDTQVSAPYLHFNNGEGLYVMPEVGAKCMVCLPSDGSQPFIMGFIAPLETRDADVTKTEEGDTVLEVPSGSGKPNPVDASFAAGRYPAKPGDIVAKTRDGNFLILHRGGVLQIGATQLCQRIFIPLGNLMMDVSERYAHHNVGGSIHWGLQEGPTLENSPTQFSQVFRVYANDKFADLRISAGKVYNPAGERDKDETLGHIGELGIGTADIVYEMVLAPDGFGEQTGEASDEGLRQRTKLRFFFDRNGGTFLRSEENVYAYSRKKIRIEAKEELDIKTRVLELEASERMHAKGAVCDLEFDQVALGPGGANRRPVARMGDPVASITPLAKIIIIHGPISTGGGTFTGTLTLVDPIIGAITGGSTQVIA